MRKWPVLRCRACGLRSYVVRNASGPLCCPRCQTWEHDMPPVSQAQRRAMRAAAAGKSTLGIPKKVGKEFSAADPGGKLPKRKPVRKHKS